MFSLLLFFRGAISVTEYEAMSWTRLETARRFMKHVNDERAKAAKNG